MPELPEVETIARGVNARVCGDRIIEAWFSSYREPFKTPSRRQTRELVGRTILSVHRTGKHIVCELGPKRGRSARPARRNPSSAAKPQAQWIVHLGMTGRLLVTTPDAPSATHTHARLSLESGLELRFLDPRRFGRLELRNLERSAGFAGPGAEPLLIGADGFAALFRGRKLAIKAALLNQSLLSGVGNIYADESLFKAGIRPSRRAGRLSRAELERLRMALRQVLEHAVRLGGSSVSDYVNAEGEPGLFQVEHCVYRRTGEPCPQCGRPIHRILIGGRGTHFCNHCQR
jgi:formamidopyrimidine-DNA glycosylase